MKVELTAEEKRSILASPYLDRQDIEKLARVGRDGARKIMAMCKSLSKTKPILRGTVTTDSYLMFCGYPEGTWLKMMGGNNATNEDMQK